MSLAKSPFPSKNETISSQENPRTLSYGRRILSFFTLRAREGFIRAIPSEDIKDLPGQWVYRFGWLIFLILLGLFAVIFTLSYQNQINTLYLSPLDGDEDSTSVSASPYCETISVSNSGTLRATQSGYWEGSVGFQYSEASYIATVTNWQVTPEEYSFALNTLYEDISLIGNESKANDLGYNLMYWFSYTARPELDNTAQRFNLIGDPLVVFNRQYVKGMISSVHGDCNLTSNAVFAEVKGLLTTEYDYSSFILNPVCNATGNPYYLGYLSQINSNLYQIKFDVRSLVTAFAVNLKYAYLSDLVEISAYRTSYTYQGVKTYNISKYYDPKYPGMSPITCITNPEQQQCVIVIGESTFAIPTFNHLGNNTDYPMKCQCSDYNATQLSDRFLSCNLFRLLAGFIYYPVSTPDGVIELMLKMNLSARSLNDYAFAPSFVASYWGQSSSYATTEFLSPSYRESLYSFCRISFGNCSLVTFSLFDESYDWSISTYYYQLLTGACQDQISTSYDNW